MIVHTGGLGDLVLASRLVEGLTKGFPSNRIVLLVREPFAQLPAIFPVPPHEVLALDFEPHRETIPSEGLCRKLRKLSDTLRDLCPAMVIVADLEPSWLCWFLISMLPDSQVLGCTASTPPRGLLTLLIREFGGSPRSLKNLKQTHPSHENDRYSAMLIRLGRPSFEIAPWPKPPVDAKLFEAIGVEPGNYIACFPTGAASTLVKRWKPVHYAAVLAGRLSEQTRLLLTGEENERPALEQFKEAFGVDARHIRIFTGSASAIGNLSVLLAHASLYFGNDTGPAHLAQAYGVPGVVVFGGGTWPHYGPWGQGSVGVVQPLGCFGCRWDCAFGHPYCLETLPVEPVRQAFDRASGPMAPASVIEVQAQPERQQLLKETAEDYHRTQRERGRRFAAAVELHSDLLIPLQPLEQEDKLQDELQRTLAEQMQALQLVDRALRAFLPAAGISVRGYEDLEPAFRMKVLGDQQVASESKLRFLQIKSLRQELEKLQEENRIQLSRMHQTKAMLEQSDAQVSILGEGLTEARRQLAAAGERELRNLADLAKFNQEGLQDNLEIK